MIRTKQYSFLLITLFTLSFTNAQQQVHIPWPSLADSPWPVMRGDMQGTGRSRYIGPRSADYINRKDMPLGIYYGPVIGYDNILFTGTASFRTESYNLFYSLDDKLDTRWEFETETAWPNNSGPTLGIDSTIYFGSTNGSTYALDYYGNLKWEREDIAIRGHPFISISKYGNLFIAISNRFAILDKNGNTLKDTTIQNFNPHPLAFSVGGDTIFYVNNDNGWNGTLNAADSTLNIFWSVEIYYANNGELLIDNSNKIYLYARDSLNNEYLYCYRQDGKLDWQYEIGGADIFSSPTIDKEGNIILYVKNDNSKREVISLDYSGNENWRTIIREDQAFLDCSIICDAEGKIYTVSEGFFGESYFHCLDSNGKILWEVFVDDISFIGSPAINSKGTIYIGGGTSAFNPYNTRNLIAISENPLEVEDEVRLNTYILLQNYPNPFNPLTSITYSLEKDGFVSLKVYDILGNEVASLVNENQPAGSHSIEFNAAALPSGIYFYRLTSRNYTSVKKLILMK